MTRHTPHTPVSRALAGAAAGFVALALAGGAPASEKWGYEGETGPEYWGTLSPEFAACSQGTQQSPVDVTGGVDAAIGDVAIHWKPAAWEVLNNGHTIQAQAEDAGHVTIGGKDYALLQFHFHAPSEHAIEGRRSPMEVHFVHKADDGALAVIGVMMEGGGENALFDSIMAVAPEDIATAEMGEADARALLPDDKSDFRYQGSLTTPPCSEIVSWSVLQAPVSVSDQAIERFRALHDGNARPLQPLNRRYILAE